MDEWWRIMSYMTPVPMHGVSGGSMVPALACSLSAVALWHQAEGGTQELGASCTPREHPRKLVAQVFPIPSLP